MLDDLAALHARLGDVLRGMAALGEASPRATDRAASYGERASAVLMASALRARGVHAQALDATDLIRTDSAFGAAAVDEARTNAQIQAARDARAGVVLVVPGFTGADEAGRTTTLGRGGSDLTASLLGAALDADRIEIWTDVDGMLTADPRLVEDAFSIPQMTYAEAAEMATFGAKVLFPPTMAPALRAGIPIHVRNTFRPDVPGTVVSAQGAGADDAPPGPRRRVRPERGALDARRRRPLRHAGRRRTPVRRARRGAHLGRAHHAGVVRKLDRLRRPAGPGRGAQAARSMPSSRPRSRAAAWRRSRSRRT